MRPIKISKRFVNTLLVIISSLIVITISHSRLFDAYELELLDLRYHLRPPIKVSDKIVIIEISDDSIQKLGSWPFDRSYHTLLLRALKQAGARQIVFDIFFSERKEGDRDFRNEAGEADNIYIPYVFDLGEELDRYNEKGMLEAKGYKADLISILSSAIKGKGHINIKPDLDGKWRRIPPLIKYEDRLRPYLGFLVGLDYLGVPFDSIKFDPGKYIKLNGKTAIPLDERSNIIVNFPGRWRDTFRHYSYIDILTSYIDTIEGRDSRIDLGELEDTVCFIGYTATAADAHASPYEPLYFGVGVHASLLNSMINNSYIRRAGRMTNVFILVLLCVITSILTLKKYKRRLSLIIVSGFILLFLLLAISSFILWGLWIDLFYPLILIILLYLALTFLKYIQETYKREMLERELKIAKDIQESFLPKTRPKVAGISIDARMTTARQVGGDLYDFVQLKETKAGIMIGDVSGKGVPAALYMAKTVSEFKTYCQNESSKEVLENLNERMLKGTSSGLFVTIAYIIFDTRKMICQYSLGGHLPIVMLRKGEDKARLLDTKEGMPLGLIESPFSEGSVDIKKGDLFVLYTDGVTEAMNAKREMFGEKRLLETVKKVRAEPVEKIVKRLHSAVRRFEGKLDQHDDITVIAIRVT